MEIKIALCLPREAFPGDPVPALAEHGRGLKIIDAVVGNLQLTTNEWHGTVVHFEKRLELLPGAAGEDLGSVLSQRRLLVTPAKLDWDWVFRCGFECTMTGSLRHRCGSLS